MLEPHDALLFSANEKASLAKSIQSSVVFTLTSKDGDQGFPGKLYTEVLVGLKDSFNSVDKSSLASVVFVYRAKLLGSCCRKFVSPVNLTQVRPMRDWALIQC